MLSSLSGEFRGVIHLFDHMHLPCMCLSAAPVCTSSPSVLCPISQSHGVLQHLGDACVQAIQLSSHKAEEGSFLPWQHHSP